MRVAQYSTAEVDLRSRLDHWNRLTSEFFPGMIVDGDEAIRASWQSVRLGETHVCIARADRSKVRRWTSVSDIRETGRVLFHIQCKGMSNTVQGGNGVLAASGEMSLCVSDDPYQIDISPNNECMVIDCPETAVPFRPLLGRVVSSKDNPYLRMLINFGTTILQQDWDGDSASDTESQHLETALRSLLHNCVTVGARNIASLPEPGDHRCGTDIFQTIVDFIDDHIGDSGLRTSLIAGRLGLPDATVQKAFAQFGVTPTMFIISRRLEKAREQLLNPHYDGSMTDLAYEFGFSDSAHFSRKFKARFNIPPTGFRRQHLGLNA